MEDCSRRSFLKGTALAAAGAMAVGITGCAPKQDAAAPSTAAGIEWDEAYDIVIVGGGLAGTAAALSVATEGNGASCLLMEKGPTTLGGGNSGYSGGAVFFTDEEHRDDCLEYLKWMRGSFDTTPDDVLEAYTQQMTGILDFLKGLGARDEDMKVNMPGKLHSELGTCFPEYPELEVSKCVGVLSFKGEEMSTIQKFMVSVVEQHADAVTHKTNARLTSLVQDPDTKEILGAEYDDNGKTTYVKAEKGVIMCCGGFENDPVMKQDYLSMPKLYPAAGVQNTGDGFKICQKVGADFCHMNSFAGCWYTPEKIDGSDVAMFYSLAAEQGIIVGTHGRRYFYDLAVQPVKLDWQAIEAGESPLAETATGIKHGHQNIGGEWPHMSLPSKSWFIVDAAHKDAATTNQITGEALAADIEAEGWGYESDTIAGLAEKIGVPVDELERTVKVWNENCAAGFDAAFYRPEKWMTAVAEPPFYAVNLVPQFLNTDGGPVRNAQAQIIDTEGNPIPRLYSSGEFGSLWCNVYQGGCNLSECIAF